MLGVNCLAGYKILQKLEARNFPTQSYYLELEKNP
jgi:hypothetical protein